MAEEDATVQNFVKARARPRSVPQTELDMNMRLTDPVWGSQEISDELKERLREILGHQADGTLIVTKDSLWSLLGFYTRDMRLANLSTGKNPFEGNEMKYCEEYLNLANDLLQVGMVKPFLVALSRVATVLELSQSKNGFYRRRINTLTTEKVEKPLEPPKRSILGFGGKKP